MERRKFEDSFKDAFEGAEVNPSEGLWTNIELDLEKADGSRIRRRLIFYQMLAAASVVFALGFAGIGFYLVQEKPGKSQNEIAGSSSVQPTEGINNEVSKAGQVVEDASIQEEANDAASEISTSIQQSKAKQIITKGNKTGIATLEGTDGTDEKVATNKIAPNKEAVTSEIDKTAGVDRQKSTITEPPISAPAAVLVPPSLAFNSQTYSETMAERKLPSVYSPKKPELVFPTAEKTNAHEPDPGMLLLAKLADEEKKFAEEDDREKQNKSEKLWTSVGFAAGGFSSVNSSVSPTASNQFLMSNSTVADKQASASGVAYSYGVNVGTRIAKRWVLQGGVNYLVQSSDYTATNVVGGNNFQSLKAESINALDKISQSPQPAGANSTNLLAPTFPYSVNNNVRFFSVPVQAGYLVVNKKFGVQLNAGISTDLFLQNTITPESGSLDKTTQGRGEDSPYRSFNFSGLMGTEFTYRFGQHYRVALNPGLRYPFNSVYKADVGVESTPLTFDVGLRFRYIFH